MTVSQLSPEMENLGILSTISITLYLKLVNDALNFGPFLL